MCCWSTCAQVIDNNFYHQICIFKPDNFDEATETAEFEVILKHPFLSQNSAANKQSIHPHFPPRFKMLLSLITLHSGMRVCLLFEHAPSGGCDHYSLIENKFARHWQLMADLPEIDVDFNIRESAGKGRGFFSMRDFQKGELIDFYEGHRVNSEGVVQIYRANVTKLMKEYPLIDRHANDSGFQMSHAMWVHDKESGLIIDGGPLTHPCLDHVKGKIGRIAVCNSGNYQQSNMCAHTHAHANAHNYTHAHCEHHALLTLTIAKQVS